MRQIIHYIKYYVKQFIARIQLVIMDLQMKYFKWKTYVPLSKEKEQELIELLKQMEEKEENGKK